MKNIENDNKKNIVRGILDFFSVQSKATVAYLMCNIILKCASFITFPIFARFLSVEDYGLITVYGTIMSFISVIVSLNLQYSTFTTAMVKFQDDKDGYLASASGFLILNTFIYIVVLLFIGKYISDYFEIKKYLLYVMAFEMLSSSILSIYMARERFDYKYKEIVFITLLVFVINTIVGFIAIFSYKDRGIARILSTALVSIIFGIIIFINIVKRSTRLYYKEYYKYIMGFSIPLIPYYMSQMIFSASDRLMIDRMLSRTDVALYEVGNKLGAVLIIVLNSINSSYGPWIFRNIKNKNCVMTRKVSSAIADLFAASLFLGIIFMPEIIKILLSNKYIGSLYVIPPISMGLLFNFYVQCFLNVGFVFEEKHYLVISATLSALINVLLNYILLKRFGFLAAAWTTLGSIIFFVIISYIFMNKILKKYNYDDKIYDIKHFFILGISFLISSIIIMYFYNNLIMRIIIFLVILIILFINRKYVIKKAEEYISIIKAK